MFIIWGTSDWKKNRGVVADKCVFCGHISVLEMTQHYSYPHLYFIPVSRSTLVATTLTCGDCGGKSGGAADAYAEIIPHKQARSLPLRELLETTNPRLADQIAYRVQLEQEVKGMGPGFAGASDPQFKLACLKLTDLDPGDPRVIDCQGMLAQWAQLEPAAQFRVLRNVDELENEKRRHEDNVGFVHRMARRFKPDVGGFFAFMAFWIVLIAGCVLTVIWAIMANEGAIIGFFAGIIISAVAGCVCAALVRRWRQRRVHRSFFQTVFLPEAESAGVDVPRTIGILRQVDVDNEGIDAKLRGLAKAVPILTEVLAESDTEVRERRPSLVSHPGRHFGHSR